MSLFLLGDPSFFGSWHNGLALDDWHTPQLLLFPGSDTWPVEEPPSTYMYLCRVRLPSPGPGPNHNSDCEDPPMYLYEVAREQEYIQGWRTFIVGDKV